MILASFEFPPGARPTDSNSPALGLVVGRGNRGNGRRQYPSGRPVWSERNGIALRRGGVLWKPAVRLCLLWAPV